MNKLCLVLTMAVSLLVTRPVTAQTFSNSTPLNTPNGGAAGLYPSPIVVSGVSGPVSAIVVTIPSLASFDAGQAALMLVSPSGGKIVLMRECGITANVAGGVSITLTDLGPAMPGFDSGFAGGIFRPTANSGVFDLGFPAPAPAGPYSTTLNSLITANVNGTWSLYVADVFANCCPTSLPSGWKISFVAGINAVGIPYQGSLRNAGSPVNGNVDLRFRLIDSSGNPVGLPCTKSAVSVSGGIFTTNLNQMGEFGPTAFQTPNYYTIETSVRNPADPSNIAPFVTLTPPTPLAMVPFAQGALMATSASKAETATAASSAPWTGITNVPANVSGAFSPWVAATGGISYAGGRVGIGGAAPQSPLHLNTGPVGTGWQFQMTNTAALPTYEAGMRVSDIGFFEITNRINGFAQFARLDSNGAWSAVSDARLKTDITLFEGSLDAALKMRPVRFRWIGDGPTGAIDFGLIAQELRAVLPQAVVGDEARGSLTIDYSKLSVVAIGALQEMHRELKAENERKQGEIDDLKARLERLERAVNTQR